jgi:predicted nucleotidyltransferase
LQTKSNPQLNMVALAHRIQPQPGELGSARLHRGATRARLERSFDVSRLLPIGSHARGTAIRWFSDLDILVVLRRNEAKWGGNTVSSYSVLARVIDELRGRFPNTDVNRDKQAAVVSFSTSQQSLDVVPALFSRFGSGRPLYQIPDGQGGWLETSPEIHDRYFNEQNERSRGKLRKVAQLLKWWKYSRAQAIPLQSFHIDILLAASEICVGVKPYTHCLYEAFKLLAERECRGFRDPCGVAGTIYATQTRPQWDSLNNAVAYALQHATAALASEAVRNFEEANRQWSIVFNGEY